MSYTPVTSITDEQIRALHLEAAAAGDMSIVDVCDEALQGDAAARERCVEVINEARSMAADDEHPRGTNREQLIAKVAAVLYDDVEAVDPDERAELPPAVVDAILLDPGYHINVLYQERDEALRRAEEAEAEVKRLRAQMAAVSAAAFDPDTVSALECGAVGTPPNVDGVTVEEALSYAYHALYDIRAALDE